MKNIFVLLPVVLLLAGCEIAETNDSKAKKLIKNYLKEVLNDYDSYSSVSFSGVDSLFTQWTLPEELRPEIEELQKCAEKINETEYFQNITVNSNPNDNIKMLDYLLEKSKSVNVERRTAEKQLWIEFKKHQDIINASKRSFKPQFRGLKMTHKYRAKNQFNATILKNIEFHFDKELSRITAQREIDVN